MTGPIERIRKGFQNTCVAADLKRDACSVGLAGVPQPYLLIDLDLPGSPLGPQSVRCDYLVFADDGRPLLLVAPIEFKTRWRGLVVTQLQAGTDEARRHVPDGLRARFRPVAALHRFSPKARRRELREEVAVGDRKVPIRVVLCGEDLGPVLR